MKPLKLLSAMSIFIAMLFFSNPALAQGIVYTPTFTGSGTVIGSLAQLRDNSYVAQGSANGFAVSGQRQGTLTFTFNGDWDLSRFTLWNNINTTWGGVTAFELRFFDSGGNSLGTLTQSNVSNLQPPTVIPLTYVGVHRVDMVIANSDTQIEIREIQFEGTRTVPPPPPPPPTLSTCCPPSATFALPAMFNSVQPNVTGNYHLNFTMNATFDAQMAAYAALLKALDPSITSTAMVVRAYNGGSATAPLINGAPLQMGVVWWVPPPGSSGNLWPLSAFFTSAADLPTDTWTVIEVTIWVQRPRMESVQLCETRLFSFRPQIVGRARSSASGFVDYRGPAPRATAPPPAMPPRR